MSTDDPHVDKINTLVRANRRLTTRELAEEYGISVGSCYEILTAKFKMHRVAVKFVLQLITDDQKANHVRVCQELLDCSEKMKTSRQELRVHKISLQFIAPSGCTFYNPTNVKNTLYLKPCSLSTNEYICVLIS